MAAADKAGIIPYVLNDDGELFMAFMIPSDSKYGGDRPAIAKGRIDRGESPLEAAVREGEEELGLRRDNMLGDVMKVWSGELTGLDATYHFIVYAVEVKSIKQFDEPHYETKDVVWMTPYEFSKDGRTTQRHIVKTAVDKAMRKAK
jgi:8-oxo-dGTP pyrophosphatase MutT (NUDIX family)